MLVGVSKKIMMMTNDTLISIQEEGRCLIQQNFEVFRSLVAQARSFGQRGKYDAAAVYADIAIKYALKRHCGIFVSPELEHVLLMIGRQAIKSSCYPSKSTLLPEKPRHVLHVATAVWGVGGHSRMIWRWIQQDSKSTHSVVLTRQGMAGEVPKVLRDAVLNSRGKIHMLEETISSLISWAKQLSKIAAAADIVVLHTIDDVIPIIAFANKEQSPPIIFVNHADHLFWSGASISDVVVNLRESGMRLSRERRGIEAERNALLPIILSPIHRTFSRAEAKRQLSLPNDSIVMLSIARSDKYRTIDSISFADAHVSLLKQHDQAILLVIGPGDSEDWSAAIQQTQGRIRVFGQTEDTAVFYQAADIYVDSFPWVSNTSLLEAGSYGVPLVSCYPYSSETNEIFGADMPGLTGNLIRVRSLNEYTAVLSRLVEDEEFRLSLGDATKRKIEETHMGSNWQHFLEDLYSRAATVGQKMVTPTTKDQMFLGEPDVLLPTVFYYVLRQDEVDLDKMIKACTGLMPFEQRFRLWTKLIKVRDFGRMGRISLLLPYWLSMRLRQ